MTRKIQKRGIKGEGFATSVFGLFKSIQAVSLPLFVLGQRIHSESDILNLRQKICFIVLIFFFNEWRSYIEQLFANEELKGLIYPTVQIPMII